MTMTPAEYYKIRLEHTLQHTQQSTRLIYLVNGAVLGMSYFVVNSTKFPSKRWTVVLILVTLAFINAVHALLIRRQGIWYSNIDAAFARSVLAELIQRKQWLGTHKLYSILHFGLAIGLLLAAFLASRSDWGS